MVASLVFVASAMAQKNFVFVGGGAGPQASGITAVGKSVSKNVIWYSTASLLGDSQAQGETGAMYKLPVSPFPELTIYALGTAGATRTAKNDPASLLSTGVMVSINVSGTKLGFLGKNTFLVFGAQGMKLVNPPDGVSSDVKPRYVFGLAWGF